MIALWFACKVRRCHTFISYCKDINEKTGQLIFTVSCLENVNKAGCIDLQPCCSRKYFSETSDFLCLRINYFWTDWRWRHWDLSKRLVPLAQRHCVTSQENCISSNTALSISNLSNRIFESLISSSYFECRANIVRHISFI